MHSFKLFTILLLLVATLNAQSRFEYQYHQMGTQIRLVFYASDQQKADSVSKLAFARIDDLNSKLSDYLADSELQELCATSRYSVAVSDDMYTILQAAVEVSSQTGGSFDISAGPLIALWRKAQKTRFEPKTEEIKAALNKVGYRYITLLEKNNVRLEKQGMALDLGAIGKGFTADEVAKILKQEGIKSALVDMGGDILVTDPPPKKSYWTLAFSYYNTEGSAIFQKIKLKNQAVATSGDLYQFIDINGIRYSHIIDPKSGFALKNGAQVTVIAPSATLADAYASAYSVIGIETAKVGTREIENLEMFMVENTKTYYDTWMSTGFADCMIE